MSLPSRVVAVIQTVGERINFHRHLHFLVTEGGVDRVGIFHGISSLDEARLAEIFAREALGPAEESAVLDTDPTRG